MSDFGDMYILRDLVLVPTYFGNPGKYSCVDFNQFSKKFLKCLGNRNRIA